jgi:hypothetical protein
LAAILSEQVAASPAPCTILTHQIDLILNERTGLVLHPPLALVLPERAGFSAGLASVGSTLGTIQRIGFGSELDLNVRNLSCGTLDTLRSNLDFDPKSVERSLALRRPHLAYLIFVYASLACRHNVHPIA